MKREANPTLLARITNEISTQHYANMPFSIRDDHLRQAADEYVRFLELPQRVKDQFKGLLIPGEPKSSIGYELKSRKMGNKDDKEFFHYNPDLKRQLPELTSSKEPRIKYFLEAAAHVYSGLQQSALELACSLESATPGTINKFFPEGQPKHFYLRFLAYKPVDEGKKLANGHYDQSPWTLAIAESRPGLRIGTEQNPQPVSHKPGQAILFCSPNAKHTVPKELYNDFKPGFHDVVEQPRQKEFAPGIPRWAIVAFLWPHGMKYMPYEEAHPTAKQEGFSEGKYQHEK